MSKLAVERLAKSYDGNFAVRQISFAIDAGKILAVCGENGAGKSTLMKMLAGAVRPDSGAILIDGEPVDIVTPSHAHALGIRTVYQELSLLPHISVGENLALGRLPTRALGFVVDWRAVTEMARRALSAFGFEDIDPNIRVKDLSLAKQQIVEIAKALVTTPSILILDEPTAVLSAHETVALFAAMRRLAKSGTTILYISHRLEEIFEIADEVVVLKDGQSVLQERAAHLTQAGLIEAMVGRPLQAIFPQRAAEHGRVLLDVRALESAGHFATIDLRVRAGEIVGMFGLVGAGRTEVAKAIFGALPQTAGEVRVDGVRLGRHDPHDAVKAGVAMITEDRKGEGLALDASVLENASLASLGRTASFGVINLSARRRRVERATAKLAVRPAGLDRPVRQLSGGNQQKVVLAKWTLVEDVRLFIFDEPTRGVDVATKVEIYKQIAQIAATGCGVLLISSEMPEVMGLSDRIVVMREGRIAAELTPREYNMETLFALAAGLEPTAGRTAS